ncbi:hypothetical protein HPB50_016169 [Hyalomma asiaticum]|uniref:Uncharacterized protein n=1 Tax=Hyalomma asiaticum TaxID=266040 RepID=A0ACB7T5B4_HYAAI|nr:hypothetical protein HPB50_016169 [Hyalomma asiaticum]
MLPCLNPPLRPFKPGLRGQLAWLDAVLEINGVNEHALLLGTLPANLQYLSAASSASAGPYNTLRAAVLASNGEPHSTHILSTSLQLRRSAQLSPARDLPALLTRLLNLLRVMVHHGKPQVHPSASPSSTSRWIVLTPQSHHPLSDPAPRRRRHLH